jgi:capsid protein
MKLFGFEITKKKPVAVEDKPQPQANNAFNIAPGYAGYNRVFQMNFDGEKDLGGIGPIRKYVIDHVALRMRGWQLYLESDVCQALFTRSAMWGIGAGLKLQASPESDVLTMYGQAIIPEEFNDTVESLFYVYSNNTFCDYSGQRTLGEIANEAWVNSDVAGDVLVVMRLVDGMPKVQLIDGTHLKTPQMWGTSNQMDIFNPATKNRVRHGVEMDAKGNHVAYWVFKGLTGDVIGDYERIPARLDKYPYTETAKLIYGLKYRIDGVRGIPLITAVMETAAKMARYKEAMVAGAESRAKVAFSIEHEAFSTGENPLVAQMAGAAGFGPQTDLPTDSFGENLANKVTATSENQAYNMPNGAKLVMHESKQENGFTDFYTTNFDIVCAVAGYPPEVIMSKYNSNYSASRAAIKDFEHTLKVKRTKFAKQFYQLVYNFCLDTWALSGQIKVDGYLTALAQNNQMLLSAYRCARWAGDAVPHIDPFKEVKAIREMLPENSKNMPLITLEQAVEMLDNGDWSDVVEQFAKERDKGEELDIEESGDTEPVQMNGNPRKEEEDD